MKKIIVLAVLIAIGLAIYFIPNKQQRVFDKIQIGQKREALESLLKDENIQYSNVIRDKYTFSGGFADDMYEVYLKDNLVYEKIKD